MVSQYMDHSLDECHRKNRIPADFGLSFGFDWIDVNDAMINVIVVRVYTYM